MKKIVLLSLISAVLVLSLVFVIWYMQEKGEMKHGNKISFIPYNSALVLTVNGGAAPLGRADSAWTKELEDFRGRLLARLADSLRHQPSVRPYPYVLSFRLEGKRRLVGLYVLENREVFSKGDLLDYLAADFGYDGGEGRRYEHYRIFTLRQGRETLFFTVCGGMTLVSDSELYIEDALKQFVAESEGGEQPFNRYGKYLSAGADVNLFLNTGAFTGLLPLYADLDRAFGGLDAERLFKWGGLDGEYMQEGLCLNGWLDYKGAGGSYFRTLEKQQPDESGIEAVLPPDVAAVSLLNLSDVQTYLERLDLGRNGRKEKEALVARQQQLERMFGKREVRGWGELLQGKFAVVDLAGRQKPGVREGLVLAEVKSGGLASDLLERMLRNSSDGSRRKLEDCRHGYGLDKDKRISYYDFPAADWAAVSWGNLFQGISCSYVAVVDNYLVFASSRFAMESFLESYLRGNSLKEAAWYRRLQEKLSRKYNFTCLARTEEILPVLAASARGGWKKYLEGPHEGLSAFPSFALQSSNENGMLYNTLFLSTAPLALDRQARLMWRTTLGAGVAMKPEVVDNHNTGEKEIFIQDVDGSIHLLNAAGRILWSRNLGERINSGVHQIDLYRNGKLQYLFSTPSKIYLIDRNGETAGNFPITLPSPCRQGMSLFDYDGDRNYRIAVAGEDRKVRLYGTDGKPVEGWNVPRADKPVVTRISHFRAEGKDYIVFADRFRLYVLDRRGRERVRVSRLFDLGEDSPLYLSRSGGKAGIILASSEGSLYRVDFSGKVETLAETGLSLPFRLNVGDTDGDGRDEAVFAAGNRLLVYGLDGKLRSDRTYESQELGYPYIYRFSSRDIRIGLLDAPGARLFLIGKGRLSQGFPMAGTTPFSIVSAANGQFYLYAGTEDGSLAKFKVSL